MLSWEWPYLLLLIPLPWLVRRVMQPWEIIGGAIRVPFYESLTKLSSDTKSVFSQPWISASMVWLFWILLVIAAAKPLWIGEPVVVPKDQRDLMLAVDISLSMREQDMIINQRSVDRIGAVKSVVSEFVKNRAGDRIGLILFGQQAFLQTPLTFDTKTVRQQLLEAEAGFAGNATAIGDAIGLAIKRLRDRPAESRVLVLLTDGSNTAGTDPMQAAEVAQEAGIRIHTVGMGAEFVQSTDIFGRSRRRQARAEIDENTLSGIADITGGSYFRARDPEELATIYQAIDRLEPMPEEQTFRPTRSLSHLACLAAFAILLLLFLRLRGQSQ